jgi:hypothetical protein
MHASGTGVPVNGVNEFDCGIDLVKFAKLIPNGEFIVDTWLTIRVWALGTSVPLATYAGRSGNKIRVNFTQVGVDPCFVETDLNHSLTR